MTETITATYESAGAAQNAYDDLLSTGVDSEKVFYDDKTQQVKVMVPNAIEREVTEILQRHQPSNVSKTPAP